MKQIIDIPDELFSIFKKHGIMAFDYFGEYDKDQIAIAIAQSTPYNPTGDCISREALKAKMFDILKPKEDATFWDGVDTVGNLIDNAPPVEITEEEAILKLHETGWLIRHDKEMTTRPEDECCDSCYLCDVGNCDVKMQKGSTE